MKSECVESARTPSQEYPQVRRDGRNLRESRWVWEQANGPIPDGLYVLHHCDNARCVRLDHLYVGTPRDNMQDRLRRGRNTNAIKTHCAQGHPFAGDNLYRKPNGWRVCVECRRVQLRRHYYRKKVAA